MISRNSMITTGLLIGAGVGVMRGYPAEVLDWRVKGMRPGVAVPSDRVGEQGWSLTAGDTGTPVAVLREDALRHNAAALQAFCGRNGVELAPHAKTTMSPELIALQLAAGAWGLTVAVPHQASVLLALGVPRILVANEIADPVAIGELVRQAAAVGTELLCYVDSPAGVRLAQAGVGAGGGSGGRLSVLVEVGHSGGRTGVRTVPQALQVAADVAASPGLRLAGVAGYEGTVGTDRDDVTLAAVDAFLDLVARVYRELDDAGLLQPGERVVTAGGSVFFDRVAARLGPLRERGATVVLRSGCYLSHDDGFYSRVTPGTAQLWGEAALQPALEVWARVVSRPEPGLALLDAGRRDLSHDLGLPVVRWRVRDGVRVAAGGLEVTGLADQHTFVRVDPQHPPAADLAVGELVGLGVSHPCTTFDKWRMLFLVDRHDRVTGAARTLF
jgi:D-serine deaminase-like pyridoxal phosphate-dependent protein